MNLTMLRMNEIEDDAESISTILSLSQDASHITSIDDENSPEKMLPIDFLPGFHDVLCGRGSKCYNHSGNNIFRAHVVSKIPTYLEANKHTKTRIIYEVIDQVRSSSPLGGFLRYDTTHGRYYIVREAIAREKTSQAFRDALSEHYKSSYSQRNGNRKKVHPKATTVVTASTGVTLQSSTTTNQCMNTTTQATANNISIVPNMRNSSTGMNFTQDKIDEFDGMQSLNKNRCRTKKSMSNEVKGRTSTDSSSHFLDERNFEQSSIHMNYNVSSKTSNSSLNAIDSHDLTRNNLNLESCTFGQNDNDVVYIENLIDGTSINPFDSNIDFLRSASCSSLAECTFDSYP